LIVLDSSGWVEILMARPLAGDFRRRLQDAEIVLVPTIVVYEVYKFALREGSPDDANLAAAKLRDHRVVPLDDRLSLEAAEFSLQHKLSMADAIIYATARAHKATLVTSDEHFANLPGVDYLPATP
jgi:toxin FitB